MKKLAFAFIGGLAFGAGLILAGMANPAKVLGFLDLAGRWDPSLAFVMGGAIAVGLVGFRLARANPLAWSGEPRAWPALRQLDKRLVVGALVFGVGWGIAGICPGPALVLLGAVPMSTPTESPWIRIRLARSPSSSKVPPLESLYWL